MQNFTNEQIELFKVKSSQSIRNALKRMDEGGIGFITIIDEEDSVIAVISNGDFRRAILDGISLEENVLRIANNNYKYLSEDYSQDEIIDILNNGNVQHIPILLNNKLLDIVTEKSIIDSAIRKKVEENNFKLPPVVIMAGGKGSRMAPFTQILPKPLIPIGDKSIIEMIVDNFIKFKAECIYISVNHKAKIIKSYFEEIGYDFIINFIEEDKPLGTAGSLKLLDGKILGDFFITNCDVVIESNYSEILKTHQKNSNDITVVASLKHYNIPYGVCEIVNGGCLTHIIEKPEYSFLVNTGMYVIKSTVLDNIHENEYIDFTDLIERVIKNCGKVGIFPINEGEWLDVGEWDLYKNTINKLNKFLD